jgi:hypothetical protein
VLQCVRDDVAAKDVERHLLKLEVLETAAACDERSSTFCVREQRSRLDRDQDFDPFERVPELSDIHR